MNGNSKPGVALIMALSVIMLLSIALMKTFESRTIETVHLANSLQRFQAESLSRSVFRATLLTIKTKGLVFVINNKIRWQGVPIFINEGQYFQITSIKPINHLFNLNRKFKVEDPGIMMLTNLVNQHKLEKDPLAIELREDDIIPVLSAINDWIDIDDVSDTEFLYNNEFYEDMDPEFQIKNRGLDRLSEVKLIPALRTLGFNEQELNQNFRIFPIDSDSSKTFIDVNLASPEEIEQFLVQFNNIDKYKNLFDAREAIRGIVEERDNEIKDKAGGEDFLEPDPRFAPPLSNRGESFWDRQLASAGITLEPSEQEVFSPFTKLLSIEFSVTVQRVTITTEAILEVRYQSDNKSLDIGSFNILQYRNR